jgi:meso-butanediol dehydrogenase / (S,S)-butanediol dehydrogenase / diacetyl reductase
MPEDNRVAIVTGATDGIGRALVDRFLADGYAVLGIGLDDSLADALEGAHTGRPLELRRGDIAREDDVNSAVAAALDRWGRLDVVCNLAAVRPLGNVVETDPVTWDRAFAVNVRGTYLMCRAAISAMTPHRRGAIVNFGSSSGHGGEGHVAYCATKGAIQALTMSLAMDHVNDGVRVNLVVPGSTRTGMNRGRDVEIDRAIARRWSVTGELNRPDEIADFVAFLVSDRAANVSGGIFHLGVVAGEPVRRIEP